MNAKGTQLVAAEEGIPPASPYALPLPETSTAAEQLQAAFTSHQRELMGTIFHLVGNSEDAKDALQEAFLKCWKHRNALAEITNIKAWIFHVALNAARDIRGTAWRRRRRGLDGVAHSLSASGTSPAADVEHAEQIARLRRAIAGLRPEEQEVFLLRENGELTYDEIAAQIKIPVGTVKTRMRLALEKLRLVLVEKPQLSSGKITGQVTGG